MVLHASADGVDTDDNDCNSISFTTDDHACAPFESIRIFQQENLDIDIWIIDVDVDDDDDDDVYFFNKKLSTVFSTAVTERRQVRTKKNFNDGRINHVRRRFCQNW